MTASDESDCTLRLPFVFVPNGAPEPMAWRARHPGWIAIPARLILPARSGRGAADVRSVRDMVQNAPNDTARRPGPGRNPAHVDRFFDEMFEPLTEAAMKLGIPPAWLIGLSSYESGWLNQHNTALNNPFGLTAAGKADLSYRSRAEAIDYWVRQYGPQVRGAASPEDFVARLQGRLQGQRVPGWFRYNDVNPDWEKKVIEQIETVQRRIPAWRPSP